MTGGRLPHLQATMACINSLNRFTANRALRSYQLSLSASGSFSCVSPASGKVVQPCAHYLMPGAGVHYLFGGTAPFVLTAGSLQDGYPLLSIATADGQYRIGKRQPADLTQQARRLLHDPRCIPVDPSRRPQLHIGDANFAHCIWNEYPALLALLDHAPDVECHLSHDPLGVLRTTCATRNIPIIGLTNRAAARGWSVAPVVMPGSILCGSTALATVHRMLTLPAQAPPEDSPRIWLTIRDSGRTLENQDAFLCAVIRAFYTRDRNTTFVLDGFSRPMDLAGVPYDALRPKFSARIAQADAIAARIMSRLPMANITNVTGSPLRTALAEVSRCAFYVSHAGTMQHKPAWFYPIPGIIHGNRTSLSPAALRWAAQMVEGSIAPAGITPDIVQDTEVRGLPVHNDRNKDYVVTDVPRATAEVLAHFDATRAVGPSPMTAAAQNLRLQPLT